MSKALIAGINQVATDKGLDKEIIFEAIEASLISAYKRNYGPIANVTSKVDRVSGEMHVYTEREVVDDVINPRTEITAAEAQETVSDAKLGDVVRVQATPGDFGRIAAQTAKQVILQRIREAERDTVYENFSHKIGETVNAQVRSVDPMSGTVTMMVEDRYECLINRDEQIPGEDLKRGDFAQLYVVDVHKNARGPVIKLSRTHRNMLRRLLEQEIPEIRDGIVEIKSISREPGARSKAAVIGTTANVDAVGSCVGMRGLRIQNIVNELAGEKIDVVEWSPDPRVYITNALSPAKVHDVYLDESSSINTAVVIVPDRQLSLAIGKEGQNARLAAKLTGWRIDIKSETEALDEGLYELIAEQQLTYTPSSDLLSMAERMLQSEGAIMNLDDAMDKAVMAFDETDQDAFSPTGEDDELFGLPLEQSGRAFDDALSQLAIQAQDDDDDTGLGDSEMPWPPSSAPRSNAPSPAAYKSDNIPQPKMTLEEAFAMLQDDEPQAAITEEPAAEELPVLKPEQEPAMTEPEPSEDENALPDVITADMLLKGRLMQKKVALDDVEIPDELLEGLTEEELEALTS